MYSIGNYVYVHSNTLPQVQTQILIMPNLLQRYPTRVQFKGFVNISPNCSPIFTYQVEIVFSWIFSRTNWQSTSTCLVRSWYTRFEAMCRAAWLSHQVLLETKGSTQSQLPGDETIVFHMWIEPYLYTQFLHSIEIQQFVSYFSKIPNFHQ